MIEEKDPAHPLELKAASAVGLLDFDPKAAEEIRAALEGLPLELREVERGEELGELGILLLAPRPAREGLEGLKELTRIHPTGTPVLLLRDGPEGFLGTLDPADPVHLVSAEPRVDGRVLRATLEKLSSGRIFGLEPYFPESNAAARFSITGSKDKPEFLEASRTFLSEAGVPARAASDALEIADELITNAFFGGPVDAEGRRLHEHLHRGTPVVLEKDVSIALIWDGDRAGISVSDPFGSLDATTVLARLRKSFWKGLPWVEKKQGGAGLGLYTAYSTSAALAFNLSPGKRTEVLALVNRSPKLSPVRSLGIFLT